MVNPFIESGSILTIQAATWYLSFQSVTGKIIPTFYEQIQEIIKKENGSIEYKAYLTDLDTVLFSIFYHDFIYKRRRHNNEQKSADVAKDRLTRLGVPNNKITQCQKQIIATKHHAKSSDSDTNYLLDFDLGILGESPEMYQDYTKKIRKEYTIYPDFIYNPGRKKVLQHFLNMDSLFKTEEFYKNYEPQARENLKAEFHELE